MRTESHYIVMHAACMLIGYSNALQFLWWNILWNQSIAMVRTICIVALYRGWGRYTCSLSS